LLLLGALALLLTACAGRTAQRPEEGPAASGSAWTESRSFEARGIAAGAAPPLEDALDDYSDASLPVIADPLEGWNRFWFGFNDVFYAYLFRPLYKAYAFVTPWEVRAGLNNALANALFPVRFVNSILQGKFLAAGVEFGRFIVNSTLGMGGLINITKDKKTIVPVDPDGEDFGQTLGVWGRGPGIYLVWPVIGPSNVRDTVGRAADMLTDPVFWFPGATPTVAAINSGIWLGLRFNAAGDTLANYDSLKGIAVDPYIAMRDMFTKLRQRRIEQ
jgi:phospholipid-binding lipoprotein MlaA